MSVQSESLEKTPKRGRGRPKGSLNKATIARMQAEAASSAVEGFDPSTLVLDVDFNSDEIMGAVEVAEAAEVAREAQVAEAEEEVAEPPREAHPREAQVAEAEVLSEPEPPPAPRLKRALSVTTKRASVRRAAVRSASPEEVPRRRRVGKPSSVADGPRVPSPTPNYLEVLKRGLEMANAAHKADRVARYDNFFRR